MRKCEGVVQLGGEENEGGGEGGQLKVVKEGSRGLVTKEL